MGISSFRQIVLISRFYGSPLFPKNTVQASPRKKIRRNFEKMLDKQGKFL